MRLLFLIITTDEIYLSIFFKLYGIRKKTTWFAMLIIALCVFLQYVFNAEHVNRDGILYIFQAQALTEGDANLARNLYPSIVFAQCIAWLHQLLSIPLVAAAHLIGFIFFMISNFFFLKTLALISKDRRLLICGLIVILTSLALDKYVVMILRDHGLWAGLMMSTYFTVKFLDDSKWSYLLPSLLAVYVAALFREEALSLIPLILGFVLWKLYRESYFKPFKNALTTIVILIVLGLIYFNGATSSFGRFDHVWHLLTQAILNIFQPLPITTGDEYLSELLRDYPRLLKFGFFVSLVTYKWLSAVGLIFLILFLIGIKSKKVQLRTPFRYFLYTVGFLTLVWPVMNLFSVNVLTSRYLVPHLWIVMLFVCLGLHQVLFSWKVKHNKFKKFLQIFIAITLLLKFIDVIVDQNKPSLDQRVAQWANENQMLKEEIFVDNLRIRYYMKWISLPTQSLANAIQDENIKYLILNDKLSQQSATSFDIVDPFTDVNISPKLYIYHRK